MSSSGYGSVTSDLLCRTLHQAAVNRPSPSLRVHPSWRDTVFTHPPANMRQGISYHYRRRGDKVCTARGVSFHQSRTSEPPLLRASRMHDYVVTKEDGGRARPRFLESTREPTHSFMALGRALARTTALLYAWLLLSQTQAPACMVTPVANASACMHTPSRSQLPQPHWPACTICSSPAGTGVACTPPDLTVFQSASIVHSATVVLSGPRPLKRCTVSCC